MNVMHILESAGGAIVIIIAGIAYRLSQRGKQGQPPA